MKVFVVIKTEYSPNYESGGADEYRSVEFVTHNKETADAFCLENNDENSSWMPSFEVEESEMK